MFDKGTSVFEIFPLVVQEINVFGLRLKLNMTIMELLYPSQGVIYTATDWRKLVWAMAFTWQVPLTYLLWVVKISFRRAQTQIQARQSNYRWHHQSARSATNKIVNPSGKVRAVIHWFLILTSNRPKWFGSSDSGSTLTPICQLYESWNIFITTIFEWTR